MTWRGVRGFLIALAVFVSVPVRATAQATVSTAVTLRPAVAVSGSATSMSVVTIPVPPDFPPGTRVVFTVTPLAGATVVGRTAGEVLAVAGATPQTILFAVHAPRYAPAGPLEVARARFSSPGMMIEVPVMAVVATTRTILVSSGPGLPVGRAGTPVPLPYRVANMGNAPDTVSLEMILPAGWRSMPAEPVALAARETVDRSLVVVPPPNANGTTSLRLVAQSRGRVVGESQLDVQVIGTVAAMGTAGPTLTMGVAAAAGPWDGVRTLKAFELRGPLSDGLSVGARYSTTSRDNDAGYAFSRANVAPTPFSLQLSSADWRVDAGVLGTSVSGLTGVNLVGRGASAIVRRPSWNIAAMAANPDVGTGDASGSFAGAKLEIVPAVNVSVSSSISRLRETRLGGSRELDAVAIGGGLSGVLGGQVGAELARRRFDGTSGSGWSAEYTRRSPDENFDVRFVHAPGGSHAFARAASEVTAAGSRKVSARFNLSGSLWRTADDGVANLSAMQMEGWTLGGHFSVRDDLRVSLAARSSTLDASTRLGEFGSAEHGADASVDLRRGPVSAQVTASAAALLRYTTPADGDEMVHRQAAPRAALRGAIGSNLAGTSLVFSGQYERTGVGVGAAPVQWSYGIQVGGTLGRIFNDALRLDASAERFGGGSGAPRSLTLRAGAELPVPGRSVIHASVERNPWVLPVAGASPWMYVVGVSRSVDLPNVSRRGTRGRVFKDLNGNGRADDGEPGFSGVVLKRRGAVAVSDRQGVFTLDGDAREPYEVDVRSLPLGWLTSSSIVSGGTREIGATAVAPLRVQLSLDDADTVRVPRSELARLTLTVRDASGREWVSRRLTDSLVVFDALPAGRYTLLVDASLSSEPLRAAADPGPITIASGVEPTPVRLVMRARQLRFPNQRRGGT